MWSYFPDLLETPVPRYTSYPTAAEFSPAVGAAEFDQLVQAANGDVSLYLHIPFCEKVCWYCGCNTSAINKRDRLESYLDALHREIALVGARLGEGARVRHVAFGGGSPNAIGPTDFVRLADELTLKFPLEAPEWSIEIDPRKFTSEWGAVLAIVGVTKASLGVQTFSPKLQAAIGRIQPGEEIERATLMMRRAGVTSLNFDLMYGLPGQDLALLEESLARSVALGADRIALFGYAHVPHLIARQRRIDASELPGQEQRFAMAALGHEYLVGAGYVPIGFDHFALPTDPLAKAAVAGKLHRNFQGFTDDPDPVLIGLGASAISVSPEVIVQNEKNTGRYRMLLSQDRLTGTVGVARSADDRRRGAIIEQLLCHGTASPGAALLRQAESGLAGFVARGLVAVEDGCVRVLTDGLPYARSIAALFDTYRQDSVRRFSSAV